MVSRRSETFTDMRGGELSCFITYEAEKQTQGQVISHGAAELGGERPAPAGPRMFGNYVLTAGRWRENGNAENRCTF